MWVRKHQGGNDLVCSVFSGPPWSFHESFLSETLPGHGVITLLVYKFLAMTCRQNHLSMSLLHVSKNLPDEAVHIPRQSHFSLTFLQDELVVWHHCWEVFLAPWWDWLLTSSQKWGAQLLSAKATPGHKHAFIFHPASALSEAEALKLVHVPSWNQYKFVGVIYGKSREGSMILPQQFGSLGLLLGKSLGSAWSFVWLLLSTDHVLALL